MFKSKQNIYFSILIILIIFTFSSNIAWLNPFPEWSVYRSFESIPFLWQYGIDNPLELASAAYFPDFYLENPTRLERPGYPLLVNLLARAIYFIFGNIFEFNYIYYSAASYIIVKILFSILSIFCLYSLLHKFFDENYTRLGLVLYFFQWSYITYFCDIHTTDTHLNSPIIIIYLFNKLYINKSILFNFFAGLCIGYLILIKSNYAIYLSLLLLLLFYNKYLIFIINFLSHLIPFLLYYLFLLYKDIPIYLHNEGQGGGDMIVFAIEHIINGSYILLLNHLINSIFTFLIVIIKYYHFFLILFFIGIYYFYKIFKKEYKILSIITIVFFFSWLQFFLSLKFENDIYMAGDLAFLIYFFVIYYFKSIKLIERISIRPFYIYFFILIINLFIILELPYMSPYSQKFINWKSVFEVKSNQYNAIKNIN